MLKPPPYAEGPVPGSPGREGRRRLFSFRKFQRDERGATAVEFSLIVVPFLALILAILETCIVFFAGQALETAVADSARKIMTGSAQTQKFDADQFKADVCGRLTGLFTCPAGLFVDVRSYSAFTSTDLSRPLDSDGNLIDDMKYEPGGPGDIVVVRVMYPWRVFVSLLGFNLSNMSGGQRLLMATATFRNEPYQ